MNRWSLRIIAFMIVILTLFIIAYDARVNYKLDLMYSECLGEVEE